MSGAMWQEQVIHDYFSAWLLKDGQMLDTVFSEDIRYSECYGPEYHGIKQVRASILKLNEYNYDVGITDVYDDKGYPLSYIMLAQKK